MNNYLTYDELMDLAMEYYAKGGDMVYETLSRHDFDTNEYFNKLTREGALNMFRADLAYESIDCMW